MWKPASVKKHFFNLVIIVLISLASVIIVYFILIKIISFFTPKFAKCNKKKKAGRLNAVNSCSKTVSRVVALEFAECHYSSMVLVVLRPAI